MDTRELSTYLAKLEDTNSRLTITSILADLFKNSSKKELPLVCYLVTGSLLPKYKGSVFNVAEKMLIRAIALATDTDPQTVTTLYRAKGDLGIVVHELEAKRQVHESITITELYKKLQEVSEEEGEGSQEARLTLLSTLLQELDPESAKFVVRMVLGRLRLGFSEKTVIDALSEAFDGGTQGKKILTQAYEFIPDIGALAEAVARDGITSVGQNMRPVFGIPVMPALCQRLKSPSDMIKKMGEVSVEPKFDGLRAQIHYRREDNSVRVFTRNLNDVTYMFPELKNIGDFLLCDEIILDSELIGMDPDSIKIADFQTTTTRRRKHGIEDSTLKVPITFQVFDVMSLNKEDTFDLPYLARRDLLTKVIKTGGILRIDEYWVTRDPEFIKTKHKALRDEGLEGVIVKQVKSTYRPGRVGWTWVKMKEEEGSVAKLPDTVDCVIIGYTRGKGKRATFGVGEFLAAIRDGDTFKTVTKVGTGLSDDQFMELARRLSKIEVPDMEPNYEVHKVHTPHIWVKPEVVVEIAGDDITVSPNHTSGYAIRFPRLVKFRDDKGVANITTMKELIELFNMQTNRQ